MRAYLLESDGHVITLRVPRQTVDDVPRVVRSKPPLPLFNAGDDGGNVSANLVQGSLPKKGTRQ